MAVGYLTLCICRFGVGISVGVGLPSFCTLQAEVSPASWRMFISAVSMSLVAVGEIYRAVLIMLDDPAMESLDWRMLLLWGSMPALVFAILGYVFLNESPLWLSSIGRSRDAEEVLKDMMRSNNVELDVQLRAPDQDSDASVPTSRPALSFTAQFKAVCAPELLLTTVIVSYSCFTMNFMFYGSLYAFPQILGDLIAGDAAGQLVVGAVWEGLGFLITIMTATFLPRKLVMKMYALCAASALLAFAFVSSACVDQGLMKSLMFWSYNLIKLTPVIGFVTFYQYSSEVYPTPCRSTGLALSMACGRMASVLSPVLFELAQEWTGSYHLFFYFIATLGFVNFCIIGWLPYETAGCLLRDSMQDKIEYKTE